MLFRHVTLVRQISSVSITKKHSDIKLSLKTSLLFFFPVKVQNRIIFYRPYKPSQTVTTHICLYDFSKTSHHRGKTSTIKPDWHLSLDATGND